MPSLDVAVTLRGPLFSKNIPKVVRDAIADEAIEKVGARMERGGRGQGAKVNRITRRRNGLTMDVRSTLRDPNSIAQRIPSFGRGATRRPNPRFNPRSKGTAWTRKNMAAARSMLPFVLRKTAKRIIAGLS